MNRLFALLFAILLVGCATKWSGAPERIYPGPNFDTAVSWLAAGEGKFDISAAPKSVLSMCCNIAADDVRLAILTGARAKEVDLCGDKKPVVDSDAYDPRYFYYSARVICQ